MHGVVAMTSGRVLLGWSGHELDLDNWHSGRAVKRGCIFACSAVLHHKRAMGVLWARPWDSSWRALCGR